MDQRKIKRTQLYRLQELQREAFDKGFNMEITMRETNTDSPWFVGHIITEGKDFVESEEGKDMLHFYFYEWRDFWTKEENLAEWENQFNRIKEFINR